MSERLATVSVSQPRRWFAVGVFWALAGLLAWLALARPPAFGFQVLLIALAALAAYGGEALRRATALSLVLTEEGLTDSAGRMIASWDAIRRIERGTFAFKPAGGFLLILHAPAGPRVRAPGLYWRTGRRVGVGGVTRGHEAKMMAEVIALRLAGRDRG